MLNPWENAQRDADNWDAYALTQIKGRPSERHSVST